ncbi:MAG TPA: IS481 family transposase [Candidatus Brocadiales bacterium]|nr:IS481 family transposase [Candidatus Brocadiales bacterium]
MSLRREFVEQAEKPGCNFRELCKRYSISRPTGYKWLMRYHEHGLQGLQDQSRKPMTSPNRTSDKIADLLLSIRDQHPAWGGRKIYYYLTKKGFEGIPTPSTITKILKREGYILAEERDNSSWHRFEHDAPNRLWQMDFKGHFSMERGRCHPLTIIDDHSRFSLCVDACHNETHDVVKRSLIRVFSRYGVPERINTDNGQPWGSPLKCARYTSLGVWLIQKGIQLSYSRPFHPQTNGKDERFNRTLKEEVIKHYYIKDHEHAQKIFDQWRECYNHERPHEALGMDVPANRYRTSYRPYSDLVDEHEYSTEHTLRKVDLRGRTHLKGRQLFIGIPFAGLIVGFRPHKEDGVFDIYYRQQKLAEIDLKHIKNGGNCYNVYAQI